RGSLGVDLAITIDVMLTNDKVDLIPSDVNGPLSPEKNIGALLIGRSCAGSKGILVVPGVIDADHTGNIKIMAHAQVGSIWVPKGTKIAQLVALPPMRIKSNQRERVRGFGSTGAIVCLTLPLRNRPLISMTLRRGTDYRRLSVLADTGADVTVID
ncbi:POK9 protein, partial [Halcyon senegalensis]|nr:POK9 protein [Halcyon senegalensis]